MYDVDACSTAEDASGGDEGPDEAVLPVTVPASGAASAASAHRQRLTQDRAVMGEGPLSLLRSCELLHSARKGTA
jgi:hypothetical protein